MNNLVQGASCDHRASVDQVGSMRPIHGCSYSQELSERKDTLKLGKT